MTRRTRDQRTTKPTSKKTSKPSSKPSSQPTVALATSAGAPIAVVHATAELAPFARTGGLGEAVRTLARYQAQAGIDVTIVMPYYGDVARQAPPVKPLGPALTMPDRKSTRLNSSHERRSRMPSSA